MEYSRIGNIKELEKVAKRCQTEQLAIGVLSLSNDLMYLNGCVKRGRGIDIHQDEPGRNVFEYIKELEKRIARLQKLVQENCGPPA